MHLGAGYGPLQFLWKMLDTLLPLAHSKVTSISLERACTHIWYLRSCGCCLRDGPLDYLALIANVVWIHKSHSTIANKEAVLNRCRRTPLQLYTWVQHRENRQNQLSPSFFFLGRSLTIYILSCCQSMWFPISLHLGAECNLSFGMLMGLGTGMGRY